MSSAPPPPPPPPSGNPYQHPPQKPGQQQPQQAAAPAHGLSLTAKLLLFVALPLVLIMLIIIALAFVFTNVRGTEITRTAEAQAGSSVEIDVANASMNVAPSTDGQVRVTMTGHYSGAEPTIAATTSGDTTTITGGCPDGWFFARCDVSLTIHMPADTELDIEGTNGKITVVDLTGELDLSTTNGAIQTSGSRGDVSASTTNGGIKIVEAASNSVEATSTNGGIELAFVAPPADVEARTTNGAIQVRVPTGVATYFIDATTSNGNVNTDAVPSDRTSDRTITLETVNGAVTVEGTRR